MSYRGRTCSVHPERPDPRDLPEGLPGRGGEQKKRQNEQHTGNVGDLACVHAEDLHALKRDQDDQAIAEYVVVESAEKLRRKEGGESPLPQQ